MPLKSKHNKKIKALMVGAAALLVAPVIGLFSSAVNASSIISVTSNIADVPNGASLVLTIGVQNDGDVYELEVDHSYDDHHPGTFPEFSVYADESDPYGGDGHLFAALGASVVYSAANNQWTIDFGQDITDDINTIGDPITFYFALRDAEGGYLWGGMSSPTEEVRFTYDTVEGTGDTLVADTTEDEDALEAIVPGVPNTSIAL